MNTESKKAFSWQIDNVSGRSDDEIYSDYFSSGGCEWYLCVYPKGSFVDGDHLSVYLYASFPESLLPGWTRRVHYRFVLLNQSGKVLKRTPGDVAYLSDEGPSWGYEKMLPHTKLQDLENDKLTIEVYINVVEVIHEGKSTANETWQVNSVGEGELIPQQSYVAVDKISDVSEVMKAAYMNILLGLIETLRKPPQSLSETELSNADSDLSQLTEAGFKLDWLKSKLEEIALKRKKAVSNLKVELDKENKKSDADATAAPRVASFKFREFFITRWFLSCFAY